MGGGGGGERYSIADKGGLRKKTAAADPVPGQMAHRKR